MNDYNEIRTYVTVNRKEDRPEDCYTNIVSKLPQYIQNMLDELPVLDTSLLVDFDYDGDEIPLDLDSFSLFDSYFGSEQFWILKHKGERYFVDTQGYDYARYCGKLID